ncbi:hypothetical protein NMG60_11030363 [Bertholletia excelsa]
MPERSLPRRITAPSRKARQPHPSPSPHGRNRLSRRRSPKQPRLTDQDLRRSNSEPNLRPPGLVGADDEHRNLTPPGAALYRPHTCTDIFSPTDGLPSQSPSKVERYSKDAKVVVNVTVEGSPGPIRTMVKLGSSVEETIKLVINKYGEEGRCPQLEKGAASTFELHQSHFSLESLEKSRVIGDVGCRSFYLCRGNSGRGGSGREIASFSSEIVSGSANTPPNTSPLHFLYAFIAQRIKKLVRRTCQLWKIMGCLHCS